MIPSGIPSHRKNEKVRKEQRWYKDAFHLNALYDLCNKNYIDAVIEPHPGAEAKAAWNMVDRGRFDKAILMGDRGYSAMNLMEHIHRKPGLDYLFRVKNGWIW